jgi:tetratricopeptide (TPR) repeat protein
MKWMFVFANLVAASLAFGMEDVNRLISDAQKMERSGETDSAISVLKEAEKLSPENTEVEKLLAQQYVIKVDDATDPTAKKTLGEMALDLARKAAEKLPDDSDAQVTLAAAYGKLCALVDPKTEVEYSKQVYAEATKALQLNPDSDFGHLILAQWNYQMAFLNPVLKAFTAIVYGKFPPASKEQAIAHYKRAIELAPERIVHHAEFAKALDVMGDTAAAREQWLKVTELKPVYAQDRRYQEMAVKRLEETR